MEMARSLAWWVLAEGKDAIFSDDGILVSVWDVEVVLPIVENHFFITHIERTERLLQLDMGEGVPGYLDTLQNVRNRVHVVCVTKLQCLEKCLSMINTSSTINNLFCHIS